MVDLGSLAGSGPFVVFLAVLLGVLLGQVRLGQFSLGVSGTLFSGLALGAAGFTVEHAYFEFSLVLFIAALGLLSGAEIAGVLRAFGAKFVALAVVMSAVAAGFTNFTIVLFSGTDPWLLRGSFAGAVTSSPSLAALLELAPATAGEALSAGYAVSYIVGVVAVILFAQFAPRVTDIDVAAERRRFETAIGNPDGDRSGSTSVTFSLAGFSLAVVLGALAGLVPIPLGPLGSVTLGLTGGTLVAALLIGHLGRVGPIDTRMSRVVLVQVRDLAIAVFLAVVGIESAGRFAAAATTEGVALVVAALLIGTGSMVVGFVMLVVVWELDWICAIGAICGGMTSTPGLGAAIAATETEGVGATYGATYPFALLAKVVFAKLLLLL